MVCMSWQLEYLPLWPSVYTINLSFLSKTWVLHAMHVGDLKQGCLEQLSHNSKFSKSNRTVIEKLTNVLQEWVQTKGTCFRNCWVIKKGQCNHQSWYPNKLPVGYHAIYCTPPLEISLALWKGPCLLQHYSYLTLVRRTNDNISNMVSFTC